VDNGSGAGRASGIHSLRLGGRYSGLKKLVRHKQTQRLFVAARRQAGMGEMNMGERFLPFGPAFTAAPKLGEPRDASRFSSAAGAFS
jgi:hypothetical protein